MIAYIVVHKCDIIDRTYAREEAPIWCSYTIVRFAKTAISSYLLHQLFATGFDFTRPMISNRKAQARLAHCFGLHAPHILATTIF